MKILIATVIAVLFVYAAACAFLYFAQERLIFHPRKTPEKNRAQLREFAAEFTTPDGAVLRGWLLPGENPQAARGCKLLIYFGGSAEEASESLLAGKPAPNAARLYVNYRGYGESEGKPSAQAMREDALFLLDEAAKRMNLQPPQICIAGRSLGSHMAAYAAAKRPVGKLAMITPFDSVAAVGEKRYPIFPVRKMLRHHFNTLAFAEKISAPTLFVLAEEDRTVPRPRSETLINHWRAPRTIKEIPGSAHSRLNLPQYWQTLHEFFSAP